MSGVGEQRQGDGEGSEAIEAIEEIAATENATDREVKIYEFTSTSSRGAASEMLACAYLLTQGYHVFRSVSPACPVDLIAYRNGACLRVEVKSVTIAENWRPQLREMRRSLAVGWPANDEWDLLLLVGPDVVHEFPVGTDREEATDAVRVRHGFPPKVRHDPRPKKDRSSMPVRRVRLGPMRHEVDWSP